MLSEKDTFWGQNQLMTMRWRWFSRQLLIRPCRGFWKQGSQDVEHLHPQELDLERQCSLGCVSGGLGHLVITLCMSF